MTADEMICRWAEHKYGVNGVVKVEFIPGAHGPYSEVTPDTDPYLGVEITYADGSTYKREEDIDYTTALLREIVEFATSPTESEASDERI